MILQPALYLLHVVSPGSMLGRPPAAASVTAAVTSPAGPHTCQHPAVFPQ